MINVTKLTKELLAAGIQTAGCNENGVVWAADGLTEIQSRPDVAAVVAAHDPAEAPQPTIEEQIAALQAALSALQASQAQKMIDNNLLSPAAP